jgi:hypothetical protein
MATKRDRPLTTAGLSRPTDNGCHVLSEETQQGELFLELIGRKHPGALFRYHQDWVEGLALTAEEQVSKAKG